MLRRVCAGPAVVYDKDACRRGHGQLLSATTLGPAFVVHGTRWHKPPSSQPSMTRPLGDERAARSARFGTTGEPFRRRRASPADPSFSRTVKRYEKGTKPDSGKPLVYGRAQNGKAG